MKLKTILSESTQFQQMKVYSDLQARAFAPTNEDVKPEQGGIQVGGYQTQHYDACPGATALYKDIESKTDDMDLAERTAKLQDVMFFIEKHVEEEGYEPDSFYGQVGQILGDQIMAMAEMMGLSEEHSYIQGHIDRINKAVGENNDVSEFKKPRQLKDKKKEMMVVKNGKVQVIDKKDWKKYQRKGYLVAEKKD